MKTTAFTILMFLMFFSAVTGAQGAIRVVGINGPVNPVTAKFVVRNLHQSAELKEQLFLIEMDTPGGLDTAMRDIVKEIFASPVPVAVHVAPSGARAASAGAIIAMAADICAMAPGTNMGAAHPVAIGEQPDKTMQEKILNDAEAYVEGIARKRGRNIEEAKKMVRSSSSLSAEKALELRVIDLVAANRTDLLSKLNGRSIDRDGKAIVLKLTDAKLIRAEMSTREKILDVISNPNVAYVLLMLGMLGLFFELSNPGVILPGVIGGISLILAFFAFQTLPVNYAGVLLIILALILFIAEINIVSHGMLSVGGVISMILGSLLLFESPEPYMRVSWSVLLVTVLAVTAFAMVVIAKAIKAHRQSPSSGREGLLGEEGMAESDLTPEGKVFVRGEYWDAWSEEPISKGERIIILGVDDMKLKVKKGVKITLSGR
jgi:membrane-bound serine protease (ClpP class)